MACPGHADFTSAPHLSAAIGKLCEKCDGKCVICDSYVRPATIVRVCDECNFGSYQGRCVICGGPGASEAYYCKECTQSEKDVSVRWAEEGGRWVFQPRLPVTVQRDGCPKIINIGSAKTDLFFEKKKFGFVKTY